MDYQELLKRYIGDVVVGEVTDFIFDRGQSPYSDTKFTEQEWTELETISKLVIEERNK